MGLLDFKDRHGVRAELRAHQATAPRAPRIAGLSAGHVSAAPAPSDQSIQPLGMPKWAGEWGRVDSTMPRSNQEWTGAP
jgi:hypothetical protein